MNTATISPALDMHANKPANTRAGKPPESSEDSPRFADVLSHQHASQTAESGKRVDKDSAVKDRNSDSDTRTEPDQPDSELARLAAQSGVAGQPMGLGDAKQAILLHTGGRGDAHQFREPAIVAAYDRQALPFNAKSYAKADGDDVLLRSGTAPGTFAEGSAARAALMAPINAAIKGGRHVLADTTTPHQTAAASGKTRVQGSMAGNVALTADAAKTVDLGVGRIAIHEFSTAMIDAADLARTRMSDHYAPDNAVSAVSANDQVASLASQILPSGAGNTVNTLGVPVPLNSPQWANDFGRQFVTMLQNGTTGKHVAELRLDPPELGPLRITLSLSDNVAHAAFFSPHASVRQTVESALPQLQELLAQAGISLGDTSVNDQGQKAQDFSDSHSQRLATGSAPSPGQSLPAATSDSSPAARIRSPEALVDTFA